MQVDSNGLVEHPTPKPFPMGSTSVRAALDSARTTHPDRLALIDANRSWTFAELADAVDRAAANLDASAPIVVDGPNSAELIIEVFAGLTAGAATFFNPPPSVDCRQLMAILGDHKVVGFTSGTSGAPKAVVHSERSLLLPGSVSLELEAPSDDERIGTALALRILNVMVLGPLSALLRQTTFVVIEQTSPPTNGLLADIEEHCVTRLFAVPTQLHDLVAHAPESATLETLHRVIVGGSPALPATLSAFVDRFDVRPTLSYGMTEAPTGVVRESMDDPIGSGRGFPLPHVEVTIVDGEICLTPSRSGPWAHTWTPTFGYLANPEQTAVLFEGDVLHTGDTGSVDADGAVAVTGRLTSLIIRGGMNVDPVAITQALLANPMVAEATVCGFPDDRLGQKVGAVVVGTPSQDIDPVQLRSAIAGKLGAHATPDVIVVWPDLPRNSLGKVEPIDPTVFTEAVESDLA